MAWVMSASTAPPAIASQNSAGLASELASSSLPSPAATTPATNTVDHKPNIAFGRKPALRNIAALAAASGIPPMNMPSARLSEMFSRLTNLAPITRHPGIVSRILPKTIASPAPEPVSSSRRSVS
jgi:hypothetical protein